MDRRRFNPPVGGTRPPVFRSETATDNSQTLRFTRSRQPAEIRKTFLQTALISSASGSAYLENSFSSPCIRTSYSGTTPLLKLSCAVHGPHSQPRNAPFSINLSIRCHVRFAPFATTCTAGFPRELAAKDLASHLETALRGVIIADRYPKCMIDIVITVLEMEDYNSSSLPATAGRAGIASSNLAMMNLLAGCMTVASAALVHAGADCLDLLSGGVAALVQDRGKESKLLTALDPAPLEHDRILAACVVGYLKSRDEIVELWHTSAADVSAMIDDEEVTKLMDEAVNAAKLSRLALVGALDTRLMADGQSTIRKTEQERRMDQMDLR